MRRPFWTLASQLAALSGFTAAEAQHDGETTTLVMRQIAGGRTLRAGLREGTARRGELALGPVALTYDLGELPIEEARALGIVSWLQALARSRPEWRSLLAPGAPEARLDRLSGIAHAGPLDGFRLAAPHPDGDRTVLDFGEPTSEARVLLELSAPTEQRPAVLRARHRTPAPLEVQEAIRVAAALALGVPSHAPSLGRDAPAKRSLEVVTAPLAPQGNEVRLILNGPCGQHCAFCSIPDTFAPSDGGDAELEGHRAVLEMRFASGARVLRLTGVDPLASSFVLPLLQHARALGFEEVMINSPCTRLSDRAFAEAVTRALPAQRGIMVPLYGADGATHDAVVDRPGAHALVMQALDHLHALLGPRDVQLSTVLVPQVLAQFGALSALARARGLPLNVYLPFPDADSPFDRFTQVSVPQRDVAARLVAEGSLGVRELFAIRGLAPCVVLRALEAAGSPMLGAARAWLSSTEEVIHDGARTPHDRCAHAETCSLRPPCSGEVLRAYVRRHGAAEFVPPSEA